MSWEKRPYDQSATTDAQCNLSPAICAPVWDAYSAETSPLRAASGRRRRSNPLFSLLLFLTEDLSPLNPLPPLKCLCLFLHDCCFGKRASAPAPATPTPCEVRPSHCSKHRRTFPKLHPDKHTTEELRNFMHVQLVCIKVYLDLLRVCVLGLSVCVCVCNRPRV